MYKYVGRRAMTALAVLFGASVLTYGMIFITPGSPAETILGQQLGRPPSQEAIREFRAANGLDRPVYVQYATWVLDVLQGDFGSSYYSDTSVRTMILSRLPHTATLAVTSTALALFIAVPAGVLSAVHRNSPVDYASQVGALLGVSMPNFWLGYLLIIVLAIYLPVLPVAGADSLSHLVLPTITLGSGMAAILTRLVRTSMLDVLETDYVRTARAKGLRNRIVVYKHALRNALIPVTAVAGLQLAFVLNGAVVVEVVFARPGVGTLLVDAIFAQNFPIVQGVTLLTAAFFVTVNFLVDLLYHVIDPRIQGDFQ